MTCERRRIALKQSVKRKIYYVSVIAALVIILASAVVINRTLVNTPEFNIDSISDEAGEPSEAYMAYMNDEGELTVGIAEKDSPDAAQIIDFVRSMGFESEYTGENDTQGKVADAWIVLYDDENRIASRMNFYNGGTLVWYDGTKYNADPANMQRLIEYCDANIEEEETPTEQPSPEAEQSPLP